MSKGKSTKRKKGGKTKEIKYKLPIKRIRKDLIKSLIFAIVSVTILLISI